MNAARKQAEKEYERCKAEYDKERAKLNELYDRQKAARKEAFQYMKNRCADIYRQSCLFLDILKKYIPDEKRQDEPGKPISQQETADEQQEYFSMKLLSLIHENCFRSFMRYVLENSSREFPHRIFMPI